MARTVAIGIQNFEEIITKNCFYVDKTYFIKEWWDGYDSVTLITRPRRFGKTLTMSMVERFFSNQFENQNSVFHGLAIWEDKQYRNLQGTFPLISLSFANIKETNYRTTCYRIRQILMKQYVKFEYLTDSDVLSSEEKIYYRQMAYNMREDDAAMALYQLSDFLHRYHKKKVIILLDEYDTPMQEAYIHGYWEELTVFTRSLFHSTFKTNPWLERAILTGITRISRESVFSDLNNLSVITTTSDKYAAVFGFTESEVLAALREQGLSEMETIRKWYNGFTFGSVTDIYNPWSIVNYLNTKKFATHWAKTSSNGLIDALIRQSGSEIKEKFEDLLQKKTIISIIDEEIIYNELDNIENAIWSLLLACGYLKVIKYTFDVDDEDAEPEYVLAITNLEVRKMLRKMVKDWFKKSGTHYNAFIRALFNNHIEVMNDYMNEISASIFSYFDTGNKPTAKTPERFYHGFVLGLLVELSGR